jgi:tRNA A-37 threonylcarbamoyl transferase component Bud32
MTARALPSADGNRIWRVSTPAGVVLQKLYGERGGALHACARELASRWRGGKTSTRAAGRRQTEARMLALWRAAGMDVPLDLSARHPDLHHADTLVLECIDGQALSQLLADPAAAPASRGELVARYAQDLGRRHRLAVDRREAGLVHEHGGVQHVLVAGDRFVTFDLENAFLPRADVLPLVYKELAAALRSLSRSAGGERFDELLGVFVQAYGQPDLLQGTVRHYLHAPSPFWRLGWALDRLRERRRARRRARGGGKYLVLDALERALRARAGAATEWRASG